MMHGRLERMAAEAEMTRRLQEAAASVDRSLLPGETAVTRVLATGSCTAYYERNPAGRWVVSVPEIRGCRRTGLSLSDARRRIQEALELFLGTEGARGVEILEEIRLPEELRQASRAAAEARTKAARAQEEAQAMTRDAVAQMVNGARLSVRDASELLGICRQRVQRLADPGKGSFR
jgi:predicted RNase H-like HicB family nuclease